jgi:hypothetical protein
LCADIPKQEPKALAAIGIPTLPPSESPLDNVLFLIISSAHFF